MFKETYQTYKNRGAKVNIQKCFVYVIYISESERRNDGVFINEVEDTIASRMKRRRNQQQDDDDDESNSYEF
jgi:hypothetical protein